MRDSPSQTGIKALNTKSTKPELIRSFETCRFHYFSLLSSQIRYFAPSYLQPVRINTHTDIAEICDKGNALPKSCVTCESIGISSQSCIAVVVVAKITHISTGNR